MAKQQESRWTDERAERFLSGQFTTSFEVAAILNHLDLHGSETGILDIGCGDGTFLGSAYNVVHHVSKAPVNLIGIDSSPYMVSRAREKLDAEATATANNEMRDWVRFVVMDALRTNDPANISIIRGLFPRGISTIVAMNFLSNIDSDLRIDTLRQWASLLIPGGRIVANLPGHPAVATFAHFRGPTNPHYIGTVNLASAAFIKRVEREIQEDLKAIGNDSDKSSIHQPTCVWMGDIWRSFADTARQVPHTGAWINDQARLDMAQNTLFHARHPVVIVADSAEAFGTTMVDSVINHWLRGRSDEAFRRELITRSLASEGLAAATDTLRLAKNPDWTHAETVQDVIRMGMERIAGIHGITTNCPPTLAIPSVLVCIKRI